MNIANIVAFPLGIEEVFHWLISNHSQRYKNVTPIELIRIDRHLHILTKPKTNVVWIKIEIKLKWYKCIKSKHASKMLVVNKYTYMPLKYRWLFSRTPGDDAAERFVLMFGFVNSYHYVNPTSKIKSKNLVV